MQGVITTHSNEMVRVAGISHLRVIRKIGTFTSNLYNPALLVETLKQSDDAEDKELANFFDWFLDIRKLYLQIRQFCMKETRKDY